ncbi:neutral/alkaline non-lysosomal ceramidase N-terminal domain-containing protein [uncultured Rubinisphaera sp.]|uniref:neutral/alkaline non-lysosomal ceramidase N-terminal domain-containing protein n=2 Tax=Rubinisphaera TaxID=1649490 RepID=UPI0030D8F88B
MMNDTLQELLRISSRILFCSIVLLSISTYKKVEAAEGWKAGVGRVVITPEKSIWMSGYAGRDKPAEGKLHDLWVKAIAFESGSGKRAVLISLDLVGISRQVADQWTALLKKNFSLERSQIVFCTSHTHCGPVVGETLSSMYFLDEEQQRDIDEYTSALAEKVNQAVATSIENLHPVALSFATGTATFAVNRRENVEKDVPALREAGTELKGPIDHALPTLFVKDLQGNVEAILFGYACHATTLGFYQWNGDWPGFAQIELEKAYPGAVAMFVAGCGADQNPIPRRTVELAEKYGKEIAVAVQNIKEEDQQSVADNLVTRFQEISIPFSELPTRSQLETDTMSSDKYIASRAKMLLKTLDSAGELSATYPYPIQVWTLGNVNIVFLGGEVVVDYSLRLKGDLDLPELWVAGYCNDVMAYIPSRRVLLEGGYEGARSMIYYGLPTVWAPQIENLIIDQVSKMVASNNE